MAAQHLGALHPCERRERSFSLLALDGLSCGHCGADANIQVLHLLPCRVDTNRKLYKELLGLNPVTAIRDTNYYSSSNFTTTPDTCTNFKFYIQKVIIPFFFKVLEATSHINLSTLKVLSHLLYLVLFQSC